MSKKKKKRVKWNIDHTTDSGPTLTFQGKEISITDGIGQTLLERGETYGEAWKITGTIIQDLHLSDMIASSYFYNWLTILCKLIRLLTTPHHLDSWQDIEGYARLVTNHIQAKQQEEPKKQEVKMGGRIDDQPYR